jgi:hypothetical protein
MLKKRVTTVMVLVSAVLGMPVTITNAQQQADGWDTGRAMKEAEAIGLRSENLEAFALAYVSTKK